MNAFRTTFLFGALALGLCACSSDNSTPGTGNNNLADGAAGKGSGGGGNAGAAPVELLADGGCPDPSTQVFDGVTGCVPRAAAVAQCKEQAAQQSPGSPTDNPVCGAGCTCEECPSEMLQCGHDVEDDGYCAQVLKCAQEHNCTGVACYQASTCQAIIDSAPNGGLTSYAIALATQVSDCATKTGAKYMGRTGNTCAAACP